MNVFLTLIISYLVGSISGSFILGKYYLHKDVRKYGSGNAGTTNAIRVFGKKIGILTFIIDMLKGSLVAYMLIKYNREFLFLGILFAILGHDYPFYMKFKGGKGIATTFGAFFIINPLWSSIAFLILMLIGRFTGYVSVGSLVFLFLNFVFQILTTSLNKNEIIILLLITILGIVRHRSNIKRLINRNELKSRRK
ncbi:glycerol-3-phosphate 1-O-acyltransferase PlsY [uncultured Peptoniphilus sp.]|uniref:glycerol-3-phosphate 1-O-acyltransferase PlsY n=1 Tax=uncultured Peptoniphilus sp. TaxID=254354 RepID=UPI00280605EF|nr:glycerol-3-phosphate 1-O-acyltransferase PlsY [uncultured Peptoniphilus sp.]